MELAPVTVLAMVLEKETVLTEMQAMAQAMETARAMVMAQGQAMELAPTGIPAQAMAQAMVPVAGKAVIEQHLLNSNFPMILIAGE